MEKSNFLSTGYNYRNHKFHRLKRESGGLHPKSSSPIGLII